MRVLFPCPILQNACPSQPNDGAPQPNYRDTQVCQDFFEVENIRDSFLARVPSLHFTLTFVRNVMITCLRLNQLRGVQSSFCKFSTSDFRGLVD